MSTGSATATAPRTNFLISPPSSPRTGARPRTVTIDGQDDLP
ncbi:hypothetical protein [Actinomadura madurae]|nr:hypothetical protein [Actinomadura madurae]